MAKQIFLILICLLSFDVWAAEAELHSFGDQPSCQWLLDHQIIVTKLGGGPYPARFKREFRRSSAFLVVLSYEIESPKYGQPQVILTLENFPDEKKRLFISTLLADLRSESKSAELYNYDKERPNRFLVSTGMRDSDERENSQIFRLIDRALRARLENIQVVDSFEFPPSTDLKNPELKF